MAADLMKYVMKAARIFPRFVAVFPNEGGVFLRMGKYKKNLEPGLYFCLPVVDEIQKLDVTPQVINLPNQSLTTSDGKILAISGAVEYSIFDVQKALLEVQNFDISLQNLSMGVIGHFIKQASYEDCVKLDDLENSVTEAIKKKACDWGLNVTRFWTTDLAEHRVYRLMSHETPQTILPPDDIEYE